MQLFDWLFRDRVKGGITVAQFPNWSLGLWLACLAIRATFHPTGNAGTALEVTGTSALMIWAVDEIARGVNPWRRILGTIVLTVSVFGVVKRVTH